MLKPKVTIGVCARNCETTIGEAVESIIMQDYPHELIEVIFVDDGSTDGTPSYAIPRLVQTGEHSSQSGGSRQHILRRNGTVRKA